MEHEYLYKDEVIDTRIKTISSFLSGLKAKLFKKDIPAKKRGGLNEITDLRAQTAKLIGKPMAQVYGLTRNWSKQELYMTLQDAKKFIKNPPACWWLIYKKKKAIYGRKKIHVRTIQKVGKKGRKNNCSERQVTLF